MTRNRGLMRYYARKEAAKRTSPDYVIERTAPVQHLHMRSQETGRCWSCTEPWPCPTYVRLVADA